MSHAAFDYSVDLEAIDFRKRPEQYRIGKRELAMFTRRLDLNGLLQEAEGRNAGRQGSEDL